MKVATPRRLKRDVTVQECPWLERDYCKGELLHEYYGFTYGCISPSGMAMSEQPNTTPYLEIPCDAVLGESLGD